MSKLTPEMKREVIAYLLEYSKGIIEGGDCPAVLAAFEERTIKFEDIENFVEEFRTQALALIPESAPPAPACSEGGTCEYEPDIEYDSTGQTVNCVKCGEPTP